MRRVELPRVWIDLCWCTWCAEYVWHVEIADEAERDAYVPCCPDCGGRLVVVAPHRRDAA